MQPKPWVFGLASALLAVQCSASNKPTDKGKLCERYPHKDWDCKKPFQCEKDWPSETGYYSITHILPECTKEHEKLPKGTEWCRPNKNSNDTTTTTTTTRRSEDFSSHRYLPTIDFDFSEESNGTIPHSNIIVGRGQRAHRRREEQCCMPTAACYDHIVRMDFGLFGVDKDLQDWKKMICCISDFFTDKPWCQNPQWSEHVKLEKPPGCAYNV